MRLNIMGVEVDRKPNLPWSTLEKERSPSMAADVKRDRPWRRLEDDQGYAS